ncbi:unnamed protein product [Lactuca saligna]|uniref:Epidermal patterning factor-like protein n=1 Tax=Lactuca saligna TaxID=75948 RepID=A0AA35ULX8_LACSI|nr:unnamed protein product [Lactuca saligna]
MSSVFVRRYTFPISVDNAIETHVVSVNTILFCKDCNQKQDTNSLYKDCTQEQTQCDPRTKHKWVCIFDSKSVACVTETHFLSLLLLVAYAIFKLMSTPTKPQSTLLFICLFLFLFLMSVCTLKNPSVYRSGLNSKMRDSDLYIQAITKVKVKTTSEEETTSHTTTTRRKLGGPGSSPPRCAWKCGRCTPCKPVHVPVPPGTPVTAEYYPEAWRCKCGNKLYMP